MTDTIRPTRVRVIADHTPGTHRTDSHDARTGTRLNDRCDYRCGARS
jgi:hypothetical protein